MWLLDHNHYRLAVRRYFFELFSGVILTPTTAESITKAGAQLLADQDSSPIPLSSIIDLPASLDTIKAKEDSIPKIELNPRTVIKGF